MSLLADRPTATALCPHCGLDTTETPEEVAKRSYGFDEFWAAYPSRNINGHLRKPGRQQALLKWGKFTVEDRRLIYQATLHYAQEQDSRYVKDAQRFLAASYWRDFLTASEPVTTAPTRPAWVPADAVYDRNLGQWCA